MNKTHKKITFESIYILYNNNNNNNNKKKTHYLVMINK